ncbi:MAG: hypothetical protein WB646_15995, partial [Steroidobacteraceae bacterium]
QVGGRMRHLVAVGDKASNFVVLDRVTGRVVHRLVLGKQTGLKNLADLGMNFVRPRLVTVQGAAIPWQGRSRARPSDTDDGERPGIRIGLRGILFDANSLRVPAA